MLYTLLPLFFVEIFNLSNSTISVFQGYVFCVQQNKPQNGKHKERNDQREILVLRKFLNTVFQDFCFLNLEPF